MSKSPYDYFSQDEWNNLLTISQSQPKIKKFNRRIDLNKSVERDKKIYKYSEERLRELSKPKRMPSSSSDEEIGPGTYDASDEFLSNKQRIPTVKFPKANLRLKKSPDSPSAFTYTPKAEKVMPNPPATRFNRAKVNRLINFQEYFDRSPGPKYAWKLPVTPTVKFNPSKTPPLYHTKDPSPAPKCLDSSTKFNFRFCSTERTRRVYYQEMMDQDSPVPDQYKTDRSVLKPVYTYMKNKSFQKRDVPGVGAYTPEPQGSKKFLYSFTKAKRDLNWKKVKIIYELNRFHL
ncbi:unnamed protein product [Blepharisma stoltei]|uniref:Uncharacterized protein n=1 Tax=Blepharisma stoltei TaxID=1481888 RepID=A0AAU9K558_9CILI|nr:unnamed protein product [Blepharisma stoltei]